MGLYLIVSMVFRTGERLKIHVWAMRCGGLNLNMGNYQRSLEKKPNDNNKYPKDTPQCNGKALYNQCSLTAYCPHAPCRWGQKGQIRRHKDATSDLCNGMIYISTYPVLIGKKNGGDILGFQMIYPNQCGDPLSFPLALL